LRRRGVAALLSLKAGGRSVETRAEGRNVGVGILILGKLCFAAIGVAVGARLAREARSQDGIGLHAVALAAVCIGGIGLAVIAIGEWLGDTPTGAGVVLTGEWSMRAGMVLFCVFIWRAFRPGGLLGGAAAGGCAALLIGALLFDILSQPSVAHYDYGLLSAQLCQLSIAVPFAWSCLESGVLWGRARRRLALGLADPAVVRRYLLWWCAMLCFVLICVLAIAAGEAHDAGRNGLADAAQAARGILYLAVTALAWLGVFSSTREEPASAAASSDAGS
jgi:hypothetical protein